MFFRWSVSLEYRCNLELSNSVFAHRAKNSLKSKVFQEHSAVTQSSPGAFQWGCNSKETVYLKQFPPPSQTLAFNYATEVNSQVAVVAESSMKLPQCIWGCYLGWALAEHTYLQWVTSPSFEVVLLASVRDSFDVFCLVCFCWESPDREREQERRRICRYYLASEGSHKRLCHLTQLANASLS